MITYPDLIQFYTFIVALAGLCYTIFQGEEIAATIRTSDGWPHMR